MNKGMFNADYFVQLINVLCCSIRDSVLISGLLFLVERLELQHMVECGVSICNHSCSPKDEIFCS
jgi:hypothetical protein